MSTCPECQFTYGALARPDLIAALERSGPDVAAHLVGEDDALRGRRVPDEWSPLEYACHVRDVLLMQRDRLFVALVEDEASFKPMYRDQRVAFDRYGEQDPSKVGDQLVMAADLFAHAYAGLSEEQWTRHLMYGYPGPERHDVEWMAHHTLHEAVHHTGDIDRILNR
jgi:DinB superfamily